MTEQEKDLQRFRKMRTWERRSDSFYGLSMISDSMMVCVKWIGGIIVKIVL